MNMEQLDLETKVSAGEIIKICGNEGFPSVIKISMIQREIVACMSRLLKKEKVMRQT